jgi:hypothetical protein
MLFVAKPKIIDKIMSVGNIISACIFKEDLYMPGKTQGIISMVCGLVSVFGSYSFGVGIIIAIVGLVMNKKAVAAGYQGTPVKVGKITSIIGLILSIVCLIIGIVAIAAASALNN